MTISQSQMSQMTSQVGYGSMLKNFLVWMGVLTVCLLILGFPVGIVIVTLGSLLAVALHGVMPGAGLALVFGGLIGIQLLGVMLGAAFLTYKGVKPQDVSWLPWLRGEANLKQTSTYAACPLTCDLDQ